VVGRAADMNGTSDESDGQLPSHNTCNISSDISLILCPTFSYTVPELLPLRKDPPPPSKQDLSVVPLRAPLTGAVRSGMKVTPCSRPAAPTPPLEKRVKEMTPARPVASANAMRVFLLPNLCAWR
jgi:hypothetical protein